MTEGNDSVDLEQLQKDVQELKDIEAIKKLRARYWQLVDAQEWDAWGEEILTEDFWFHSDAGIHEGRDLVVETMRQSLTGGKTVHHGHSPQISITGADSATGVWPMNDYVTIDTPSGNPFVIRGYGYYHDEYRRTPDGWRLARCRMERLRVDTEGEYGV
jgi:hypothetical protein